MALDTVSFVHTPELVELRIRCAGPVPRAFAYLIDAAVRFAIMIAAVFLLTWTGDFGAGVLFILYFALEWLYPVVFEVLWAGATPGKRALDLTVVTATGSPVGWGASLIRNLLRVVDLMPMAYGLGLVTMWLDRDFRRIGDIVAGTMVAYRAEPTTPPTLPEAPPWWPPGPVSRQARQAVLAFAERAPGLSAQRQQELARLVPAITGPVDGNAAVQRLVGYARRLSGRDG